MGVFVRRPKIETISRVGATYVRGTRGRSTNSTCCSMILAPFIVDQALQSDRLSELEAFAVQKTWPPPPLEYQEEEIRFQLF